MKAEELYGKHFQNAESVLKKDVIKLLTHFGLINEIHKEQMEKRNPKKVLLDFMKSLNTDSIKQIENNEFEKVANNFLNK